MKVKRSTRYVIQYVDSGDFFVSEKKATKEISGAKFFKQNKFKRKGRKKFRVLTVLLQKPSDYPGDSEEERDFEEEYYENNDDEGCDCADCRRQSGE